MRYRPIKLICSRYKQSSAVYWYVKSEFDIIKIQEMTSGSNQYRIKTALTRLVVYGGEGACHMHSCHHS